MRRAIIDVGSNSVLTLIAERQGEGWLTLLETSCVTALGEGTKATSLLGEPGMEATLSALKDAFTAAESFGVRPSAFGTMALRIASNAQQFLDRAVQQQTPVKVISGEEEAELSLLSVLGDPLLRSSDCITVVDVGGHSTEVATCKRTNSGWERRFSRSHPIGTLQLRSEAMQDERLDGLGRMRAAASIDDSLGWRYLPNQCGAVVAVGAAGTNLVTVLHQMPEWDPNRVHGTKLQYEQISKAVEMLCDLDDQGRSSLIGIEPGRERTIHAGALILERLLFALGAEECSVSVRGWRHAMLDEPPSE